jgi:hypothetical protein
MNSKLKKGLVSLAIIIIATSAVVLIRVYILNRLKDSLHEKLDALNDSPFNVRYDSIYMRWGENLIVVDKLVVSKNAHDTVCVYPEFIAVHQVQIRGFHLFKLLFNNELNIKEVTLQKPHMIVRNKSRLLSDSSSTLNNQFSLVIDRLTMNSAHLEYTDSASCELKSEFFTSAAINGFNLEKQAGKSPDLTFSTFQLDSTRLRFPEKFYSITIRQSRFDHSARTLDVDTVTVIPHLSKIDFGRKKGFDIDRIEGVAPFIKFKGLTFQYKDTFSIQVQTIAVQFFLHIFHDKRLPHQPIIKPLPVQMLRQLPFGLVIDTLTLAKSYVSYEEFAPGAERAGTIFFDNLSASISNISNDRHLTEGETRMNARADFMGQGNLKVETVFPWKGDKNCQMKGTLKNFHFAKINPMLTPSTPLEIQSGLLDNMAFTFLYNESSSSGEVMMNYQDLKVVMFKDPQANENGKRKRKKKDNEDEKKDNLKTFLLNTFILRKNMDGSLPEEKRTGTITFERDETRSIFNYWWKSLFSGIQSAFHLDKLKAKNSRQKNGR